MSQEEEEEEDRGRGVPGEEHLRNVIILYNICPSWVLSLIDIHDFY